MEDNTLKRFLVSTLTFGRLDSVIELLTHIVPMLETFSLKSGIAVAIIVRNNDPTIDVSALVSMVESIGHTCIDINVISGEPNTGFGRGHNENLRLYPSEFILILNDDIGFPHLDWLPTALSMFESDPLLVLIGDNGNPQYLNPTFGNGVFPTSARQYPLRYVEASVILGRGSLLQRIGMFDESFAWAMSEDADLSLVMQSLGYHIAWLPMPHEHRRSSSFNKLPAEVRSSVQEHNRARLFAKWGRSISTGTVGRYTLIDLWSDGIGDVFCALPHLLGELNRLPPDRQAQFVINTNHAELIRALLPETVQIVSHSMTEEILRSRINSGFAAIRTTRWLNYSSPVSIHALLAGALSLPIADAAARALFRDRLWAVGQSNSSIEIDGRYCVFHSEFTRQGHDGRTMSPLLRIEVLRAAAKRYEKVVVVGLETSAFADDCDLPHNIVNMKGKLSTLDLIGVIGNAAAHVGIDSFPAHVAQAFCIPSVIFFGSVHPQARLWPDAPAWPLVAELSCIGCYHLHLEPGIPFCLRRDRACEHEVAPARIEEAFDRIALPARETGWPLMKAWQELQARHIELQIFHPVPKIATARAAHFRNEHIANLLYDVTDRIADLYQSQRGSAIVDRLEQRVRELETRLADRELQLAEKEVRREVSLLRKRASTSVTIDLSEIVAKAFGCDVTRADDELDVASLGNDPQIIFQPVEIGSGAVSIRIESVSSEPGDLELFWSEHEGDFVQSQSAQVSVGTRRQIQIVRMPNRGSAKTVWLRIDPLNKAGRIKLRLTLLEHQSSNVADAKPAVERAGKIPFARNVVSPPND